jgi:aspartate/methionine/tyrosine aminotransferase
MLDDLFASIALEHKDQILRRSRAIVRDNLAVLDAWVADEPCVTYVKPRSGTTALLRYDLDLRSRDLCVRLVEETGVMLTPGSALDMEGYLRIGYANRADVLHEGLRRLSHFLRSAL